jgi:5,10-methylenetetrahydrofolate reductase
VCRLIKECGIPPVFQLTCRDRNRIALQSDLLSAAALGIENVLLLTGDHMVLGDHPQARKVFDLDSVQLIAAAKGLNAGRDVAGHELESSPDLCLGAVVNPGSDDLETQLIKMEKKIEAGAEFFQTQAVYDPATFEKFMEAAGRFGVPVMVGIVPLKSAGMAKYMTANVAGVKVPKAMIKRMADTPKPDRKKVSAEIAAELVTKTKDCCQGVHLMPLGWDDMVPEIVKASGVR